MIELSEKEVTGILYDNQTHKGVRLSMLGWWDVMGFEESMPRLPYRWRAVWGEDYRELIV